MFKQRLLAALVLVPIVLLAIFKLPALGFRIFVGLFVAIAFWEWSAFVVSRRLTRQIYVACGVVLMVLTHFFAPPWLNVVAIFWWCIAFGWVVTYPASSRFWAKPAIIAVCGCLTLIPGWQALTIMQASQGGPALIVGVMFLIWSADTAAYFAGRKWGKRKLAPRVSPGKTLAGVAGALAGSGVVAVIVAVLLFDQARWLAFLTLALVTVLASILGDLTESMFKRQSGLKDSGSLIPGHGGVLDRIDSLCAAVPVFCSGMLLVLS